MNPIAECLAKLRQNGETAFIPYLMGGDPDLEATRILIKLLAASGADLIEVGVPFSDPLADGPTIQRAAVRALANGCSISDLLKMLTVVTTEVVTPLILMIYYNQVYQRGVTQFLEEIAAAGCAGLIIPDLPHEEAESLCEVAKKLGLGLNFLVAPTSSSERIAQIEQHSTGFLYAVSLKGVTGARASLPPELSEFIARIKKTTTKPVGVGFGISTPEQAAEVANFADAVIVGSAIVAEIEADLSFKKVADLAKKLAKSIKCK